MVWGYVPTPGIKGLVYKLVGHPHPIGRLRAKVALKYIEKLKTIDVGCGEGIYVIELSKRGLDMTGIDDHRESIIHAREKCKLSCVNPKLYIAGAEKIPAKRGEYEQAICFDVIEHVKDPNKVLKEINRILKLGGKLILTVPNRLYLKDSIIPYDFENHIKAIGHIRYGYFHIELKSLLEKNGFRTTEYEYYYKFFSRFIIEIFYSILGSKRIQEGRKGMYKHSILSLIVFALLYPFMNLDVFLKRYTGGCVLVKAYKICS